MNPLERPTLACSHEATHDLCPAAPGACPCGCHQPTVARCATCGGWVPLADVLAHADREHGVVEDLLCWPDGRPVVVDETVTAADIGGAA